MKISDAIKYLTEAERLQPNGHIAIAWWDSEFFKDNDIKNENWPYVCERIESKFDWSHTNEQMEYFIDYILDKEEVES